MNKCDLISQSAFHQDKMELKLKEKVKVKVEVKVKEKVKAKEEVKEIEDRYYNPLCKAYILPKNVRAAECSICLLFLLLSPSLVLSPSISLSLSISLSPSLSLSLSLSPSLLLLLSLLLSSCSDERLTRK